jgi:septal ring factor EnvC (AmiA/AmiB activator)
MNPDENFESQDINLNQPPVEEGYGQEYAEPAPAAARSSPMPWMVAGVALVLFLGALFYAHKSVGEASARAEAAEGKFDELKHKLDAVDKERKALQTQAQDAQSKFDDVNGKLTTLTNESKAKDAALAQVEKLAKSNAKGKVSGKVLLAALGPAMAGGDAAGGAAAPAGAHGKHGKHGKH